MSTITMPETQSSMSRDALDVMNCFASELDEVIYEIAERIAQKRNPSVKTVQIEVEDVREAARLMSEGVHDAVLRGQFSSDVELILQGMQKSFQTTCDRK